MMFARVWHPKVDGKCQHLFPVEQPGRDLPDDQDVEAACGEIVPRGDISQSEHSETAVYCHGCLLHAGSAVRLHRSVAA